MVLQEVCKGMTGRHLLTELGGTRQSGDIAYYVIFKAEEAAVHIMMLLGQIHMALNGNQSLH